MRRPTISYRGRLRLEPIMMMLGFKKIEIAHSLDGECGAMKRCSARWHKKRNTEEKFSTGLYFP